MKKLTKLRLATIAAGSAVAGSSFATVPADVSTAITGAGTDSITVATAVLVVIVGIFAFKLLRRAL